MTKHRSTKHRLTGIAGAGVCIAALTIGGTALTSGAATAESTPPSTPATGSTAGTGPVGTPAENWKVNTDDCVDPAAANAKIEGEIKIGSIMPLSGGGPAILFAPVKDGFAAYIQYANEHKLLGDVKLSVSIEDDQYKPELTPGALTKLLDGKVSLLSGVIGTPNNESIRQTLNDNCIPQLNNLTGSPKWGEAKEFPWTTGGLIPYDVETKAYVADMVKNFPNGAKVAVYTVNSDFGKVYLDTIKAIAAENKLEIVDEQTIEPIDGKPPVDQVTSIAAKKPDAILAAPLGLGCGAFLKEVAAKKKADSSWQPRIYATATCASPLLMANAGEAADGIISSTNLLNVADPANAENPGVKEYLAFMKQIGFEGDVTVATTGWAIGELTVAILAQAQKSPEGLTRASIINAARSIRFHSTVQREGADYVTNGEADPYPAQSMAITQFDAKKGVFVDIVPMETSFETK